jgi:hypothetical protein
MVLNNRNQTREFWSECDNAQHITWKELKTVILVVQTFLPQLACGSVMLHENNQTVCHILAGLTLRSPSMMTELRKLWHLLGETESTYEPATPVPQPTSGSTG